MSKPDEEDRSYEEEYVGMGTRVPADAKLSDRRKTKARVDHEPEEQQPPRRERRSGTQSSPRAPPDAGVALSFLKALRREGPWVLTAIIPDGATTTRTFEASDEDGVRKFIEANNATKNIYFTGNPCGRPNKKPTKADMTGAIFLHTDDDPREGETPEVAKKRILAGYDAHDPRPSIITDTGNGLQGFWLLDAEYQFAENKQLEEIELRNKALAARLGTTPGTHNVDRLLRLPGTVNIPGEAKRKKGRVDCMASIVRMTDARYALTLFEKAAEKAKAEEKSGGSTRELPQWLDTMLFIPDSGANNPAGGYETRSHLMFAFVTMALRHRIDRKVIAGACLDTAHRGHAIYEHCTESGGAEYVERQINRAQEKTGEFERDENNKIRVRSQHNIRVALGLLGVTLSYDEFSDRMLIKGLDKFDVLNDAAIDRLWLAIDQRFKLLPPNDFFVTVVKDFSRANKFHPVCDYLDALKWDGVKRIDNWLVTYAGTKDTAYTRAVGRLMLIAAVRRVRKPGCKFDEMILLEGPQGGLKSTLLRTLAIKDEWFSDDLPLNVDSQKFIERVRGRWIIEASELKGMKTADVEHLKAMLSRTHDRARAAWGRMLTEMPRHCVIAGTTNDAKYFRDLTGNRRFWPIAVTSIDIDAIIRDRDQLWAEAAAAEAKGESIRLAKELWQEAGMEQEQRLEEEPWKEMIEEVLGDMEGKILKSDVREIINRPSGQFTAFDAKRLVRAMKELGWQDEKKLRFGGDPQHCWYRGNSNLVKGLRTIKIKISYVDNERVASAEHLSDGKDYNPRMEDDKEPL